jgi:hypothetical protein
MSNDTIIEIVAVLLFLIIGYTIDNIENRKKK